MTKDGEDSRSLVSGWFVSTLRPMAVAAAMVLFGTAAPVWAVDATVDVNSTIATMPEYGMGVHTSVYDNSLSSYDDPDSEVTYDDDFDLLPGRLDDAGVDVLRYPGGGYADMFHFSTAKSIYDGGIMTGHGTTPFWGQEGNYGYVAPRTDFGSFINLLDATNSKTVITVNTGGAMKYNNPLELGVPTHGGQPQEAAAWVAYANANASIYGTAADIDLGTDAEGNDWKTAGYWAKLRESADADDYESWATADGVYDERNELLAIGHGPVGIEYWEIGNETFGTGYYEDDPDDDSGDWQGYALNYAAPYVGDNSSRVHNAALSPAEYGQQVLDFTEAMKAIDSSIKVGAVLATPRTSVNNPIGDYEWSFPDLDFDEEKDSNEPYWNDEVLSQTDSGIGKVADVVDFVIAHWYPNGSSGSIVNEPRNTIPVMIHGTTSGLDTGSDAGLRDSIATWRTDGDQDALEIFITETDGYGGSNQSADGLFTADMYATFFENGVSNVDYLELHNGQFMAEYSNEPNFAYWGVQSVHLLAKTGDELVDTTTSESDVRIHAAVQDDGSVAVMILNMNTSSRTVDVSISGDLYADDGVRYQTNGDTALSMINVSDLGNSFSTSIAGRTLQVFIIPAAPGVPGDYNGDGVADAADYAAWRDNLGASGTPGSIVGDGTSTGDLLGVPDGLVDEWDFTFWRANFGATAGGGSGAAASAVPEPSTSLLAIFALVGGAIIRASAKCRRTWT